jgi:hypothetical protein
MHPKETRRKVRFWLVWLRASKVYGMSWQKTALTDSETARTPLPLPKAVHADFFTCGSGFVESFCEIPNGGHTGRQWVRGAGFLRVRG